MSNSVIKVINPLHLKESLEPSTITKNRIHRRFPLHVYQNMTTDVTEFKTQEGKKSELNPIMNMAIGESLPFLIHLRPDLDFVLESLKGVLPILKQVKYRTTIHSDQG